MRYIKMCLFLIGVLFGLALMGLFGLIGFLGIYGVFVYLIQHCPELLVFSGMLSIGIGVVTIGWDIFCKFADKLGDC